MQKIGDFIQLKEKKEVKLQRFQAVALKIIAAFGVKGTPVEGSIFKCCKIDLRRAEDAFTDCKELGKMHPKYFFKVFSEIKKRYERD